MQRYSDQASRPSLGSQSRSTIEDERPATTTNTSVARRAHSSSKEKKVCSETS